MEYYEPGCSVPEPKTNLPRRRIASSLLEFSNDALNENDSKNGSDSFDYILKSSKSSPRFHMKPVHTLAVLLLLVVALCASLTMLISQSLTYQRVQSEQNKSLQKITDNANYPKHSFENLEDNNTNKSSERNKNNRNRGSNKSSKSSKNSESNKSNKNVESSEGIEVHDVSEGESNSENGDENSGVNSSENGVENSKNNTSRINLNTATLTQLQTLKGVGPKTAERIIAQRKRVGGFRRLEDLLQIKGIGPKTLNKFRGIVYVG